MLVLISRIDIQRCCIVLYTFFSNKVSLFLEQTDTFADKTFTVGDNKIYGNATNCALKPAESYAIMIVLIDEESSVVNDQMIILEITSIRVGKVKSKRYDEIWIIPIAIFLIVGALVFYFYQRCKQIFLSAVYDRMK